MLEQLVAVSQIPLWFWIVQIGMFGAIIGSFLNVYIYRFHTGKSLNGRSHCLSCGTPLRWYELIPIVSFLALRGRCRTCGSRITPRYAIVEVLTAGLFVGVASVASGLDQFVYLLAVVVILIIITVYDYYHFIIPDELTAALTVVTVGWLGYQWWGEYMTLAAVGWTVGAALLGSLLYFALWAVSHGRWLGFGDVKLAVPLGLLVGTHGVFSAVVLSFWVGAIISLAILGFQSYQRGKQQLHLSQQTLTMKSAVPFAPFMIIGALLVYFFNINVLSLFSFIY